MKKSGKMTDADKIKRAITSVIRDEYESSAEKFDVLRHLFKWYEMEMCIEEVVPHDLQMDPEPPEELSVQTEQEVQDLWR